jgi:resuscitation-promoting factor RpfA
MNRPSEPLTAEERDLAQRLARLGGPREPAPALDAIILAAARAAVSEPVAPATAPPEEDVPADPKVTPLRPRKPAPRWPLGMGLAASLVLAAGIGWRLQGDGDGSSKDFGASSAPAAVFHEESTEAVILEPPLERTPPPPPPPLGGAADAAARRADVAQAPMAKTAPAPSEQDFVADAAMTESVAPAEAPAASPPPAGASANVVAADDALDKVSVTGSRVAAERSVGAAEYTRTPLSDRREEAVSEPESKSTANRAAAGARPAAVASPPPPAPTRQNERARGLIGSSEGDSEARKARDSDGYDASPPVSADSSEFRQAWLQRIRGHIAKGEQDAARNSLQEFRRRYPDIELPEDLRKLAATLPAP